METLYEPNYERTLQLLESSIAQGQYLINVFAPASTPRDPIIEHLRCKHEVAVFSFVPKESPREKICVVLRYRQAARLEQNVHYVLFSTYPLGLAAVQIPIFRQRTTHPLYFGACMILDDHLERLHKQLKYALLSLSKNEKRENEFRDELQILRDKGIISENRTILITKAELAQALAEIRRK